MLVGHWCILLSHDCSTEASELILVLLNSIMLNKYVCSLTKTIYALVTQDLRLGFVIVNQQLPIVDLVQRRLERQKRSEHVQNFHRREGVRHQTEMSHLIMSQSA